MDLIFMVSPYEIREELGDSLICLSFEILIQLPHFIKYSLSLLVMFSYLKINDI